MRLAIVGTAISVNTMASTPIGMLIPKIHRQLAFCTSRPPSTGPMAGASAIGMLMIRLSRTRSFGGKLRYSMAIPTGVISPPPMPCTIRKITNCSTVWASPQASGGGSEQPERRAGRPPWRRTGHRASRPPGSPPRPRPGSRCSPSRSSSTGTPRSAAMVGSATLTTVASMMLMNIAATKTAATADFGLIRAMRSPPLVIVDPDAPACVAVPALSARTYPSGGSAAVARRTAGDHRHRVGARASDLPWGDSSPPGSSRRLCPSSIRRSSSMTDLDLGSGGPRPPAGRPRTPGNALVLTPPAPVQVVAPEQAAGAVPVADPRKAELQTRAASFAMELAGMDVRSPEFTKKVESITALGDREMRESANVSSRMLDRPAAAMRQGRRQGRADPGRRHAVRAAADRSPISTRTGPT